MTLAFIFFIIIPFGMLALYTYNQSQRSIQAQLIANSQTTVKQIKYTIESKIDSIESVSNNITYNYRLQLFLGEPYSLEKDSLDTYFNYAAPLVNFAMLFQKVNIHKISVYSNNESIPEGFGSFYSEQKIKEETWYEAFMASDKKSLWVLNTNQADGSDIFRYIQKMISIEGHYLGITIVDVRSVDLLEPAESPNIANQPVYLVDEHHNVIPQGSEDALQDLDQISPSLLARGYAKESGFLYVAESLKGVQYRVIMAIPLPPLLGSLQLAANLAYILTFIVLLIAFYFVLKMTLSKMKASIKQMDLAIASGFQPIPNVRKDEFGVITEKFNILLHKINLLLSDMIKKETLHKDAQLIALQSQINPHFIYNTLDIFSAKMEIAGQYDVSDAMADFGKMMRYNMDGDAKFATLQDELGYLAQYMNLQKLKFSEHIHFRVHVPSDLLSTRVLKFILQPIVENSVKHGFAKRDTLDIDIYASQENDFSIRIGVKDNGAGISAARLEELNLQFRTSVYPAKGENDRESIGLGNINERLKLFYGEHYPLRLRSIEGQFTEAILTLPYDARRNEANDDVYPINN
ncbi:cache domain-containing sensor histidine kinase [Paenibacillus methanolicus]|uniref:cache domain-containing sensor histidine kinase n=1 Tax=Paenibacillus methanolicus TaxID=582686 RepID=UPI0016533308|nr:sensor histidine kinase [Paenibacillus methanolicus]